MSVRAKNVLHWRGIETVEQLARATRREILSWKNCGYATVAEVHVALGEFGLRLAEEPQPEPTPLEKAQARVTQLEAALARAERLAQEVRYLRARIAERESDDPAATGAVT